MESPDTPWAAERDGRVRKKLDEQPSRGVVFFLGFLRSNGISRGRLIDIGCGRGRNAAYFAEGGFEVHAVDRSDDVLKDIDLHGVMPHCHSVTDGWFFEDGFFDLAMDIFCYSEQPEGGRAKYREELMRVMKCGGYFLLAVPAEAGARDSLAREFSGFEIVASTTSDDRLSGRAVRVLNLVMKKK